MNLAEVFKESLVLLKKEPKVFVPRIFTTFLFTFFVFYSAKLGLGISRAMNETMNAAHVSGTVPDIESAVSGFSGEISFFAVFFLLTYVVDILTYGMYVGIASDFHSGRAISLVGSLGAALSRSWTLFVIGTLAIVFVGFFLGIYTVFGGLFIVTQSPLFLLAALGSMLIALALFAFVFFFAVPVAMVEKQGAKSAIMKSASLGLKYRGPVLKTNMLFVGMMAIAVVAAMATDFKGAVAFSAILVFIIGRLFQALVYTYISVVNPSLYLSIEDVRP